MPIEYFYNEPENVLCVKIKVPVVLAEEEIQVVVDNVITLPELAQKVDHIDARLDEFNTRPIFMHENGSKWISIIEEEGWDRFGWRFSEHRQPVIKKVLVDGILHKQIYYVNKDNIVKHVGEDVPFSDEVTLDVAQPVVDEDNVFIQLHNKKIDMRWDLRRGSRLHQTGVMIFQIKVVEERQIFVQVCPQLDRKCVKGVNLLRDGSFEAWGTPTTPIFWGASNVIRENNGAVLGAIANESAALFQTVNENVVPTGQYRLCFDLQEELEAPTGLATASFILTAELIFYDRFGNAIFTEAQSYNAGQIPETFSRFCINAMAPEDARSVLVRFNFEPVAINTSSVLIDNVVLECTRVQNPYYDY